MIRSYIKKEKEYVNRFGERTMFLMQCGSFYEVYCCKKNGEFTSNRITEFSRICDMRIANKRSKCDGLSVFMSGFPELHLEKYVNDFVIRQFLMKNLYRLNSGKFSFYPNIKVLEKSISVIEKFPYTRGKFNKPVLFLKGETSNYINIKTDKDLIRSYFPNSKILEIEKAGHWIHFDRPDLFFNIVKDWINIS